MPKKYAYGLILFLIVVWLLSISVLFNNLSRGPEHFIRWFNDHNDRLAYMQDGVWLAEGGIPYKDVPSEYPQVPTYLFGLLYLFARGDSETTIYFWHSSIFSLLMLAALFLTIRLLYTTLPERKWRAWLMLLPASLYFTYNRFDILPAFLCLAAYLAITDKKSLLAGLLLGIGAFTKWYPALLLPPFLTYNYSLRKRLDWKLLAAFAGTCILIILPTLLTAGWDGFLSPYRMHAGRGLEQVSLPALLELAAQRVGWALDEASIGRAFLLLQLLLVPVSLFVRVDDGDKLLQWVILITGAFILFSQIFSPQWMLWLLPFLILSIRRTSDLVLILLYNLFAYLAFPVGMDIALDTGNDYPLIFVASGLAIAGILAAILARAFRRAEIHLAWNFVGFLFKT